MSRRPPPRQPGSNGHNSADNGRQPAPVGDGATGADVRLETAGSTPVLRILTSPPGRLTLSRMDWASAILLAIAIVLSPIWAATFANPPAAQGPVAAPGDTSVDPGLFMNVWTGPLVLVLIAGAFGVMAVREWKRPVTIGAVPGLAMSVGLLAVWATLSTLKNPAVYISLNMLSVLFACIAAGGMISRLARDRTALAAFALTIVAAGCITAGIGVNEYLQYWKLHDPTHRTFATFLNPDFLAGYLLLTIPITLAAFTAIDQRLVRLCTGVALAVQTACLLLTASRSAIAVAAVSLFVFLGLGAWARCIRPRVRVIGLAFLIAAVTAIASVTPILARFESPNPNADRTVATVTQERPGDSQAHSGAFRKWTWIGAVQIALHNPLLGTGIGTFDTVYPRYAQTAYTSHAHNTFLQWAAETGIPGILLLVTSVAALSAFAANILVLTRRQLEASGPAVATAGAPPPTGAAIEPAGLESRLLLAGFCSALAGSMLKGLFDSDWYIAATLLTLCAVSGLLTAQARALAPLAVSRATRLGPKMTALGLLVCGFVIWRAGQTGFSRWEQARIPASATGEQALARARLAAIADPFDPEPHLLLSQLQVGSPEAETELKKAAHLSPSGKTYYLLGRYYLRMHAVGPAMEALKHALDLEPNNVQTLRLLADTQRDAGLRDQARATYETIAILETAPYGTVRAMPEYVETEFAYAHARLADMALAAQDLPKAEAEYARADAVLRRYWLARHWGVNEARTPQKRRGLVDLYIHVLVQWRQTLQQEKKPTEAEATLKEQTEVEAEAAADQKAEDKTAQ